MNVNRTGLVKIVTNVLSDGLVNFVINVSLDTMEKTVEVFTKYNHIVVKEQGPT